MPILPNPRRPSQHRPVSMRYLDFAEGADMDFMAAHARCFWHLGKLVMGSGIWRAGVRRESGICTRAQSWTACGIRNREAFAAAVRRLVEHGVLEVTDGTKMRGQMKPPPRLYRIIIPPDWVYVDVSGKEWSYGGNPDIPMAEYPPF